MNACMYLQVLGDDDLSLTDSVLVVQAVVPGGQDPPGEWGGLLRESYLIGKPQSFGAGGGAVMYMYMH